MLKPMNMKNFILFYLLFFCSNFLFSQVGIGTPTPKSTLDIAGEPEVNTVADGILIPRLTGAQLSAKSSAYSNAQHGSLVYITSAEASPIGRSQNVLEPGFYYYDHPTENDPGIWRNISKDDFFYLPSVVLPVNPENVPVPATPTPRPYDITYHAASETYTVDLYEIYKHQLQFPIKSSNNTTASVSKVLLHRNLYEYHILFADDIFTDITFLTGNENLGKFTYKISPSYIVKTPPFMNIVMKVK